MRIYRVYFISGRLDTGLTTEDSWTVKMTAEAPSAFQPGAQSYGMRARQAVSDLLREKGHDVTPADFCASGWR